MQQLFVCVDAAPSAVDCADTLGRASWPQLMVSAFFTWMMVDLIRIAEPFGVILCWFDFMSVLDMKSDIVSCLTHEF
jgi:hypothetical protein